MCRRYGDEIAEFEERIAANNTNAYRENKEKQEKAYFFKTLKNETNKFNTEEDKKIYLAERKSSAIYNSKN